MRRVALLGLLCACGPLEVPRPEPPLDAETEVWILGPSNGAPVAFHVADAESDFTFPPVPRLDADRVEIAYFANPPSAYGWSVGPITSPPDGVVAPDFLGGVHYELEGAREWKPSAQWRDRIRIGDRAAPWCAGAGECRVEGLCEECVNAPFGAPADVTSVHVECPVGWFETAERIARRCRPFEGEMPVCGPGTYVFAGESTCHRLGRACTSDPWPSGVPSDALFVSEAGTASGDGSRARPVDLGTAIARATSGDTIVIAGGAYESNTPLRIDASLVVHGECESEVRITADIEVGRETQVDISGLSLVGSLRVAASATVALSGASVRAGDASAVDVTGRVALNGVVLETGAGVAVDIHAGASANLERVAILSADEVGVRAANAEVVIDGLLTTGFVTGVVAIDRAVVRLSNSAMLGARTAIYAFGSEVTASAIAVQDGFGLVAATEGSEVTIAGSWTERSSGVELEIFGATLSLVDHVAFEPASPASGASAFVHLDARSHATVSRLEVSSPHRSLHIDSEGVLDFIDMTIARSPSDAEALIISGGGERVGFVRATILEAHRGIVLRTGTLELDDVTIDADLEPDCSAEPVGLLVEDGNVEAHQVVIDVVGRPAVQVRPVIGLTPVVSMVASRLERRPSNTTECNDGAAAEVFGEGRLSMSQFEVSAPRGTGLALYGTRSSLRDGVFTEGAIGVHVHDPEFPVADLLDKVRFDTDVPMRLP